MAKPNKIIKFKSPLIQNVQTPKPPSPPSKHRLSKFIKVFQNSKSRLKPETIILILLWRKIKNGKKLRVALLGVLAAILALAFVLFRTNRFKTKTNKVLAQQKKELETLNATKDKLFAIIAHDLKNPLSAFRNLTGHLENKVHDLTKEEMNNRLSDQQLIWLNNWVDAGRLDTHFNTLFFTNGDSREPELAGIHGAIKGTLLTLMVTLLLSFPIGVAAAIYLEEFAPKNRITDLIEININNLAAVPSIIFGLLGLAIFINFMYLPRSAPLVGGLTLALMTLPTIIITSRAAIKAVPPSIKEAAIGLGASHMQTVFHHILPLSMPGILTGSIIGMAQALGETAPLLMIGMVAFIVDTPGGILEASTALPVQVYLWADSPERGFLEKTSAAIMVLLLFLIVMNGLAIWLRQKFEKKW